MSCDVAEVMIGVLFVYSEVEHYIKGYIFFFFKQKTEYDMRISDWSSDVCSSDLLREPLHEAGRIGDFAAGFRERLALFGGHDRGEIVGMGDDQAVPFLENGTAIGGGARAPFGECRAGGIDRRLGVRGGAIGQRGRGSGRERGVPSGLFLGC